MAKYGNETFYNGSAYDDVGIGASSMVGSAFQRLTQNLWAHRFYAYGKRNGVSAATVKGGIYSIGTGGAPDTLVGESNALSFGSSVESWKDTAIAQPLMLRNTKSYFLDLLGQTNDALIYRTDKTDAQVLRKLGGLGASHPDPAPTLSLLPTGNKVLMVYVDCDVNSAPFTPGGLAPLGTISTTTPQIEADFRDLNGAWGTDRGDQLTKVQVQVRDFTTKAMLWDYTYNATPGEKSANRSSVLYAGSGLTRGVTYEQRTRHADRFEEWSDFSIWGAFTVTNIGYVTLDGAPTGRLNSITGITFNGRWNHANGLSTNAVQIRIVGGQTSPVITKTVASSALPGMNFTISWAESAFSDLNWTGSYQYQIRGRDTAGNWSGWSDPRSFTTDAAPSVPTNLTPTGGDTYTSYPTLRFAMTDADDTWAGTLTGVVRLTRPRPDYNAALDINPTNYNSTSGLFERPLTDAEMKVNERQIVAIQSTTAPTGGTFTLTFGPNTTAGIAYNAAASAVKSALEALASIGSGNVDVTGGPGPVASWTVEFKGTLAKTDVAAITGSAASLTGGAGHSIVVAEDMKGGFNYGTYSWKATGYDGTIYSGGQTLLANASFSPSTTFVYQTGPTISIGSPANNATLAYSSVPLTWTASSQSKYRVEVWKSDRSSRVYDTGIVVSGTMSHTVPSGYLRNGSTYDIDVTVWDSFDLSGLASVRVTISFTPVTTITGFQAFADRIGTDPFPASITMYWDPTTLSANQFRHYSIWREGDGEEVRLLFVKSPQINSFTDHTPRSGVDYTYKLRQVVQEAGGNADDTLESSAATAVARIDLQGAILSTVENGDVHRVVLHFADERSHKRQIQEAVFVPLAGPRSDITGQRDDPKPVTVRSRAYWWETTGTYQLVTDAYASAHQRYEALVELDRQRQVCVYRDERGRQRFVRVVDMQVQDVRPYRYTVQLTLREEEYLQGEV